MVVALVCHFFPNKVCSTLRTTEPQCGSIKDGSLSRSLSLSLALPRRLVVGTTLHLLHTCLLRPSPPLNPDAALFSPRSTASGEELSDWLLFDPSFSEGRSPALGRPSVASLAASFANVIKGKGKEPIDTKGKAPMDPASPLDPQSGVGVGRHRCRRLGRSRVASWQVPIAPPPPASCTKSAAAESWQLVVRKRSWRRMAR
jgi:hypothetical protein